MIARLVLFATISAAMSSRAAEQHVMSGTLSPNKEIAVVEERDDSGDRDYYFVHQPSGRKVGLVLPADQRHQISNVEIVASWNTSSTKVALLVFYGTKLNELLLHSRGSSGDFQEVDLPYPDPTELYREHTGKTIPQPGDGFSQNGVGPWIDDSTVSLVAGEAKQTKQLDRYIHVFATFRAHIAGTRAEISQVKLLGPLSDEQSARFSRAWGDQYFEAHE